MSTIKERIADNNFFGNEIVDYSKEESFDSFQDKIKSHQLKSDYIILLIRCIVFIFILLLTKDIVPSNEDYIFNKMLNGNKFLIFHIISSNIYRNRNFYLNILSISFNIINRYLFISIIALFLRIYIKLNDYYKINFWNIHDYLNEFIFYSDAFLIFINKLIIIELNTIEVFEGKEGNFFCTSKKRETWRNYPLYCENDFFEQKIDTTNIYKLFNDKKNKNDNIIIIQRNKRKIFLIRNIKRTFIKIIANIILLNLFNNIILNNKNSLIEYKSYNITLKIKGFGNKNILSSHSNFKK